MKLENTLRLVLTPDKMASAREKHREKDPNNANSFSNG
jgi:hypothetical protein